MLVLPVLRTQGLVIRPFSHQDINAIHRILDLELADVDFGSEGAMSLEQRADWLEWTILSYQQYELLNQPPYGERAVTLAASGELIGAVGLVPCLAPFEQLHRNDPAAPAQPFARFTPEVGLYYAISPAFQRQGYASEAARVLVQYAFTQLKIKRIVATTTFENTGSIKVMQRLDMQIERNSLGEPAWFQVVGTLENPA